MPVLVDFESRSRADLKRIGGRNYWSDPSTSAICAVLYDTDTHEVALWVPGEPCPVTPNTVLGAHNARGFDRFATLKYWGLDIPIDTSEAARRKGLRGALDALGGEKDTAGNALTLSLSGFQCRGDVKRKDGTIKKGVPEELKAALREYHREAKRNPNRWPAIPPEIHARVVEYCADDVKEMSNAWPELEPWLDIPWENDVLRVDRAVNERGVAFDSQLAQRLLDVIDANGAVELERCAREIGMAADVLRETVMSPEQFAEFTGLPDAKVETVDDVIDGTELYEPRIYWAAVARRAVASIARGKLEAGLARVSPDGRLRDTLLYYGGHPGRWSHRGMQLGNMPRPEKRFEDWEDADVCRAADAVLAGGTCDQETVDVLLRATLIGDGGPLNDCDFSGVESRAAAWFAGDEKALEVIASGKSEYKVMAAEIYQCRYEDISKDERYSAGKIGVLACGYGGGPNALLKMARKMGINLDAAGVDAQDVVNAWRTLHAPIVRLWYALEDALLSAVRGEQALVTWHRGRHAFTFTPSVDGRDVAVFLPSGRPVVYNQVRESPGKYRRPRISYQGTKPWREDLYGGKILQNLNEAFCRDMMADALVRSEDAGLEPVLHVHDSIATQRGTFADLHQIMVTLPEFAEGFPIAADGHSGLRYRK